MAVCDARYCFTMVDVGAAGRNSDGGVLKSSTFGKRLASGTLNLPAAKTLPGSQIGANHVFIGDGAFPLGSNMLRPFPGQWLSDEKVIFNYRLSRARTKIENAFGILAAKWRIFLGTMPGNIHLVVKVTQAALCLHNWLMKQDYTSRPSSRRYILPGEVDSADCEDGTWRQDANCFRTVGQFGSNTYTLAAKKQRDTFVSYFMEKGEVPWQWSKLPRRQV
jgi:DDE superfamily endonuclease